MRSAKQYVDQTEDVIGEPGSNKHIWEITINTAINDAIKECAELSCLKWGDVRSKAIKKDILSLINELK